MSGFKASLLMALLYAGLYFTVLAVFVLLKYVLGEPTDFSRAENIMFMLMAFSLLGNLRIRIVPQKEADE